MPVYLSRWVELTDEEGTRSVPAGAPAAEASGVFIEGTQQPWAQMNLGPSGWCILRTGAPIPTSNDVVLVADSLDEPLQAGRRAGIANRLGIQLNPAVASTARWLLPHLLLDHGNDQRPDRWNRLRAAKRRNLNGVARRLEIWLGDLVWSQPVPQGGAVYTDDFNRADNAAMGGSWTEVTGNTNIVSNEAVTQTNNTNHALRWEADLASDDHYSQADIGFPSASCQAAGTAVRFASGATTYYKGCANPNGDLDIIQTCTAGSFATIASQAHVLGAGTLFIRTEANGSTISVQVPGSSLLSVTDTSITGNLRAGIDLRRGTSSATNTEADNWEAGDLSAGYTLTAATETDTAQALTAKTFGTLPVSTETDTAQALTGRKRATLPVATTANAAQALTASKSVAALPGTETDSAQTLTAKKLLTLPVAVETDTAQTLSLVGGTELNLPVATETDTAQALTAAKYLTLPVAVETAAAVTLTATTLAALPVALETDEAQALTVHKAANLPAAAETDTAAALTAARLYTLPVSTTTDVAQAFTARKLVTLPPSLETDTAQTLTAKTFASLPTATETDEAVELELAGVATTLRHHISGREPASTVSSREPATTASGSIHGGSP